MADYRNLMPAHYKLLAKLGRTVEEGFDLKPEERRSLERDYRFGAPGVSDDASMVDFFESPRPMIFPHVIRLLNCGFLTLKYAFETPGMIHIMDVGAGRAELMNIIRAQQVAKGCRLQYVGVDIDIRKAELFHHLYPKTSDKYIIQDFREGLPAKNNTFEAVISTETLEHIDKLAGISLLEEINRILVPGGIFVLTTPDAINHRNISIYHAYEWKSTDLENKLIETGFKTLEKFWYMVPWKDLPIKISKKDIDKRINSELVRALLSPLSNSGTGGLVSFVCQKIL